MNFYRYLLSLSIPIVVLLINGCATQSKSIALGGAIGAGTGGLVGAIADPGKKGEYRTRNVIIGSALGGMAGALTGALVHERSENTKESAYQRGKQDGVSQTAKVGTMPQLKNPQVETQWIDGKIVGNRYIEGHYEYLITEQAHWESN